MRTKPINVHESPVDPSKMSTLPRNSVCIDDNRENIGKLTFKISNSPIKLPEISIIPVTPESKNRQNYCQRLLNITSKFPQVSSNRSPRKGGWL